MTMRTLRQQWTDPVPVWAGFLIWASLLTMLCVLSHRDQQIERRVERLEGR